MSTIILTRPGVSESLMFAIVVTVLLVFVPPYERLVYYTSPEITREDLEEYSYCAGYKAGEDLPLLLSAYDIRKGENNHFRLQVKAENVEATGVYKRLGSSNDFETNKLKVLILGRKEAYGQFYIVTLKSGERIPVLAQGRYLKKRKGLITFPVCMYGFKSGLYRYEGKDGDVVKEKYNLTDCETDFYVDAAENFEKGKRMENFRFVRSCIAGVVFLISLFGFAIFLAARRRG